MEALGVASMLDLSLSRFLTDEAELSDANPLAFNGCAVSSVIELLLLPTDEQPKIRRC